MLDNDNNNNNPISGSRKITMMVETDRMKLQRNYHKLIEVSYSNISAHLISNFILDLEMHAEIDALPTDKRKIEKLLTILPSRGNRAIAELINALKPNYNWLAESLGRDEPINSGPSLSNALNDLNSNGNMLHNCNIIGNNSTSDPNDNIEKLKLKDISISKYLIPVGEMFQRSPRVIRNWALLANMMQIDLCSVGDIRRQMNCEGGLAYAINTVLDEWVSKLGPSQATFARLIALTKKQGVNDVTEALIEFWETLQ